MDAGSDAMDVGPERRNFDVSVVVVVQNMAREAPHTLYSLSACYQRHIDAEDFEVIVVDNGSSPALDEAVVRGAAWQFPLDSDRPASVSPAQAINR